MQTDANETYRLTAERTGKSEDLYKEIGKAVFQELYNNIRRPKKLIVKLKGVGTWYLRRSRIEKTVDLFPPDFENKPEETDYFLKILAYENKIEIYNLFKERIEDYKRYIDQRQKIRTIRNGTQERLNPD